MELVNWGLCIEESTLVEQIVAGIAVVGHDGFDLGVSERSKLDIQRSVSSLEADCSTVGCSSQCKELGQSDLHGSMQENCNWSEGSRNEGGSDVDEMFCARNTRILISSHA